MSSTVLPYALARDPSSNPRTCCPMLRKPGLPTFWLSVFPMCSSHPGVASPSLLSTALSLPLSSTTPCALLLRTAAAAERYADLKRKHADMRARCERQNVGFEPLVLESAGGYHGDTCKLLESLCKIVDAKEHLPPGHSWQELRVRLSIDLQRGLHGACMKQRLRSETSRLALHEVGLAFLATCL